MNLRSRMTAGLLPATMAVAGTMALGAPVAGAAAAPAARLSGGQIKMWRRTECVTASGTQSGAAVVLHKCQPRNAHQRWILRSDATIKLAGTGMVLSVAGGQVVLSSAGTATDDLWFPQGDRTLVNTQLSADPQHQMVLDWPGSGAKLTVAKRTPLRVRTGVEQFSVPRTIYAATVLTNRPDSGGNGTWALDSMLRQSSVTALNGGGYEASIVDNGAFVTVYGNSTPNQGLDPGKTLGDDSVGRLTGTWGYAFNTTAKPARSNMPKRVNGLGTVGTGSWYTLFFAPGTTFNGGPVSSGPLDWSWSYRLKDNCGNVETWVDADNDNGGQATTGPYATDITAPGPGTCA